MRLHERGFAACIAVIRAASLEATAAALPRDGILDPNLVRGCRSVQNAADQTIAPRLVYDIEPLPDGGALVLGTGFAVGA